MSQRVPPIKSIEILFVPDAKKSEEATKIAAPAYKRLLLKNLKKAREKDSY